MLNSTFYLWSVVSLMNYMLVWELDCWHYRNCNSNCCSSFDHVSVVQQQGPVAVHFLTPYVSSFCLILLVVPHQMLKCYALLGSCFVRIFLIALCVVPHQMLKMLCTFGLMLCKNLSLRFVCSAAPDAENAVHFWAHALYESFSLLYV